jgi:hypothetical protein
MVITRLSREDASTKAIQFMASQNYKVVSKSDTTIVFEDGKDFNTGILILGILFLLIGAILYYLLATKHSITITMSDAETGLNVQCTTSTQKSMLTANQFLQTV